MARVLKGSCSFTCTPRVHPLTEWTIPDFAFPAEAGTHLPTPEGWKAEFCRLLKTHPFWCKGPWPAPSNCTLSESLINVLTYVITCSSRILDLSVLLKKLSVNFHKNSVGPRHNRTQENTVSPPSVCAQSVPPSDYCSSSSSSSSVIFRVA